MFLFRRHHHRLCLCKLLAILFGLGFLFKRSRGHHGEASKEKIEAGKAKARLFRSKLKEAFSVWMDEPEEKPQAETQAETDKI